jgi:glycine/D-amino acid oxidase-like deaminating enzyme
MRAFLHGTPAVPAWGMQRFPEQLVAALPSGVVQLNRRVKAISATGVDTDDGPIEARAVIVAADPATASALAGLPDVPMRALTTYWFAAEQVGVRRPILQVDGRREGPVVNAACLSAAAPAYSPDGRSLIAATVVGAEDTDLTSVISAQLSDMYLADAREWSLLRVDRIANALPVTPIPLDVRRPVELNERLFVAGDHRDTPSQQGALASGARAARAVQRRLGVA